MSNPALFPYCDGETLQSRLVELDWQSDGSVRILDGTHSTTVPPGDYTISDQLGSIPRFLRIFGGGVIQLSATSPVPGLVAYEKTHPLARAVHWLESRAVIAAAATALVILIVSAGFWQGLPRLCRRIAYAVPASIERNAGQAAYKVFSTAFHRSQLDFLVQDRVQRQLDRITAAHPPHVTPKLIFLAMGTPNAFALPGGTIVVADELVKYATTDDEIAAVLAHELGHIELRHGLQSVLRSSAALVVVSTLTGDLSTLSTFSATLPFLLLQYGYAREFETEADGFAVALLQKAEINPDSLASILQALEAARGGEGSDFSYLSTHPSTGARIDALYQLSDSGPDTDSEGGSNEQTQPIRISWKDPEYPAELRASGTTGEALIDFVVTRNGDVVQAKVVRATHPLLGEAAAKAVAQWKFSPGKVGKRRVNTRMQQPVTFSLAEDIPTAEPAENSENSAPAEHSAD